MQTEITPNTDTFRAVDLYKKKLQQFFLFFNPMYEFLLHVQGQFWLIYLVIYINPDDYWL